MKKARGIWADDQGDDWLNQGAGEGSLQVKLKAWKKGQHFLLHGLGP
ncbi:MAG: hypothetical protein RLZZ216_379 [Cyanobacteriota bacterium]|jgi:hypothetical protein